MLRLDGAWEESAMTPHELRATLDRLDLRRTAFNGSEFESCHGGGSYSNRGEIFCEFGSVGFFVGPVLDEGAPAIQK